MLCACSKPPEKPASAPLPSSKILGKVSCSTACAQRIVLEMTYPGACFPRSHPRLEGTSHYAHLEKCFSVAHATACSNHKTLYSYPRYEPQSQKVKNTLSLRTWNISPEWLRCSRSCSLAGRAPRECAFGSNAVVRCARSAGIPDGLSEGAESSPFEPG